MRAVGLRRRGRRTAGQALVEFALAAPVIIVLLGGGAQVATIAYGHVTVATAAREVARYAAHHPDALPTSSTPYVCGASPSTNPLSDTSVSAPICNYVSGVSGALAASQFTITITGNYTLADAPPDDVVRVSTGTVCTGQHDAEVDGTVTPSSVSGETITVKGTANGITVNTGVDSSGHYILCIDATGGSSATISASTGTGCGFYSGSAASSTPNLQQGSVYTGYDVTMSANSCPTPTPTATPTPTPSSSSSSSSSTSTGTGPVPPAPTTTTCENDAVQYVKVQVSYTVGVFIPFIGTFFVNSPGGHQVTETVTLKVEPCDVTGQ